MTIVAFPSFCHGVQSLISKHREYMLSALTPVAGPAGVIVVEGAPTETEVVVCATTRVPAAARRRDRGPDVRILLTSI